MTHRLSRIEQLLLLRLLLLVLLRGGPIVSL